MTLHEQGLVLTTLVMLIISSDELLIQVVIHEAPSRWALTGVVVVEITLFLYAVVGLKAGRRRTLV